ncbi:hypothetical protein [Mesorhizobium sp. LSJC264A00]|uniref:hypothetical protein n=1 Tax=unclassified Mesorhizobium TaxID=325217 RepID=UPI00040F49EC|nr:hypothetical protein [Mesorhizobium sp. LSJC264A00]
MGLPELPPLGPVSVLPQSGNMIVTVLEDNRAIDAPGFDIIAGLGNRADVGYDELIEELCCARALVQLQSTMKVSLMGGAF